MLAKPTKTQIEWHECERIAFVHYDPATWQGNEYDDGSTPFGDINPTKLDTDQWCKAALSWGAKQLIFVAKHAGGFCWWQTQASDYGIKQTPYKGGKGDVLDEIYQSCKKHGLRFGVYISPADAHCGAYNGGGGKTTDPSQQQQYNDIYRAQLVEIFSRYPDIAEVWFDGGIVVPIADILEKYLPNTIVFQGKQFSNIRWCGNEAGVIPYPAWNTLSKAALETGLSTMAQDNPDGDAWAGLEVDTPLYDHNWFWNKENESKRKSLDKLIEIYYKSAGRGSVLLLNSTPTTEGIIPEGDMQAYAAFGKELSRRFDNPIAATKGTGIAIELQLNSNRINHIILREEYAEGHRVREFHIDALCSGEWRKIYDGTAVGVKHIIVFDEITADALRLTVTKYADTPLIRDFSAYCVDGVDIPALIQSLKQSEGIYDCMKQQCATIAGSGKATIDLSPYIKQAGQYRLTFEGNVSVQNPMLILEGVPTEDMVSHYGGNTYIVTRTAAPTDQTTTAFSADLTCNGEVTAYISQL